MKRLLGPCFQFIFCSCLLLGSWACQPSPSAEEPSPSSPPFNPFAEPASASPELFGPGTVSTLFSVRDFTLSPAGDEFFYTLEAPGSKFSVLMHSQKEGEQWSQPEIPAFSGSYRDLEPAFSLDGNELFFTSTRPMKGDTGAGDYNLWKVEQTEHGWGHLEALGPEVNSDENEYYPSVTEAGDIYFTAPQAGPQSMEDIYVCRRTEEGYAPREKLPPAINSEGYEYNAYIDPYESFILFGGYGRPDGLGGGDLYISRKDENDEWLPAENLGPTINSSAMDYCPFVTADGQTLFFSSARSNLQTEYTEPISAQEFQQLLESPLNGSTNIYRIQWNSGIQK